MGKTRDRFGRFVKGKRYSPSTEFKKGQHWRKPQLFRDQKWLYDKIYTMRKRPDLSLRNKIDNPAWRNKFGCRLGTGQGGETEDNTMGI